MKNNTDKVHKGVMRVYKRDATTGLWIDNSGNKYSLDRGEAGDRLILTPIAEVRHAVRVAKRVKREKSVLGGETTTRKSKKAVEIA